MKTVDVVIPVHNSAHWLAWCLEELFRFESVRLRNVFVINDRSEAAQSNKINEIVARHANVKLIAIEGNTGGFGHACNLAASKCSSDIILFLNTDCLLTEGLVDRLCTAFDIDSKIVLACPFSNNSSTITYPMLPGFSYRDMAALFTEATKGSEADYIVEACTIVGNCLMVRRDFFEEAGGFSSEWGVGYGEETDLHMKALSQGLKGVVHTGCYVYHFGGGTFNYQQEIEAHRKKNHQLFMSKWAEEYNRLATRCESVNPVDLINRNLELYWNKKGRVLELDVLFYLPSIDQSVGGVNAVIAICNELIRRGIKASIALTSIWLKGSSVDPQHYKDPILFNFVHYESDQSFLSDCTVLPKVVFSTIFWSAPIIAKFASDRNSIAVQFVQGYEGYFKNGAWYVEVIESYKSTNHIVTTSNWLFKMVSRHVSAGQVIQQLPLVVNTDVFFSDNTSRSVDVLLIFRSSPDKGQWLLAELLDRLVASNKSICVLCASDYSFLKAKYENKVQFIDLPIDQYSLAKILRQVKVYVDASLHEGYGLIPLEAALCGCSLVLTDSGGVRDFVHHYKGKIITHHLDIESILTAINQSLDDYDEKEFARFLPKQNYSGEAWHKYYQDITKDKSPPSFSVEVSNKVQSNSGISFPASFKTKHSQESTVIIGDNASSDSRIKKLYKSSILPYIPQRLHLALKALLLGKV